MSLPIILLGGEITYVHLNGNLYEVTLKLYGDCVGADLPMGTAGSPTLRFISNCSATLSRVIPMISLTEV